MNIVFDHQAFSLQRYGGISRYFYELLLCFEQQQNINSNLAIKYTNNHYLLSDSRLQLSFKSLFPKLELKGKKVLLEYINRSYTNNIIRKHDFDIFHPTYFNPYFLKNLGDKPFVLTIHDMNHELFADQFESYDHASRNKKLLAQKAAKIIAVSNNTKKDIIDLWGIDSSKIEVIYHGFNNLDNNESRDLNVPKNYFLYVGARNRYKNFGFMVKALTDLLQKEDLFLIAAGGGPFTRTENNLFKDLGVKDKILHYSINDSILSALYKNAIVFIFPSLYEGFGMPVLEAFANKCPVVASNKSSLPEVADQGAVYFDPENTDSILQNVKKVISDEALRKSLIINGTNRLEHFSWKKTAQQTARVYQEIA